MAKQYPVVDISTDNFNTWITRTNDLVVFANVEVVSVNSFSNATQVGALTNGTGHVNGHFSANIITTNSLKGGNTLSLANLTVYSNTIFNEVYIMVGNSTQNIVTNSTSMTVNNTVNQTSFISNTTGTTVHIVDNFAINTYRGGQYTITIKDTSTSANAYQVSQLLVLQSGATDNAFVTEYGIITSNASVGQLGVFSANANSTHVKLNFTPTVANSTLKGSRTLIAV